jgi:hypothetical protein
MRENLQNIIEQFVDLLLPQLTQSEATVYIFFLRHSGKTFEEAAPLLLKNFQERRKNDHSASK